jgi:hypothetical protein
MLDKPERTVVAVAALALLALGAVAAVVPDAQHLPAWSSVATTATPPVHPRPPAPVTPSSPSSPSTPSSPSSPSGAPSGAPTEPPPALPYGAHRIFGVNRVLVAYYGTADTGALGVLGETDPDTAYHRLRRAAKPFVRRGSPVQTVYELIATVADGHAGKDGSYSHDIPRAAVQRYIDAAHRNNTLLLLDLQAGRDDFPTVARRWAWALKDPWVGLALDPEWRMGPHQVPARVIGSVDAAEVNRTSAWLHDLVDRHHLPQKLFVLHQFRTTMIRHIEAIQPRAGLVMAQHVDGFGTPGQKLDTFHTVARPGRFLMGFKLFYHQDVHRMSAAAVRAIRPRVRFVSFQ